MVSRLVLDSEEWLRLCSRDVILTADALFSAAAHRLAAMFR